MGVLKNIKLDLLRQVQPHVFYHIYWLVLGTVSTHAGYEEIWVRKKSLLQVGSFFHQIHHRYFNCNYGNPEIPFDRWFGSYNDGT